MEEMIHEALGFFCILWPITGVLLIFTLGAWILHGLFLWFLIGLGAFAADTIIVIVLSLYAE